MPAVFVSYSRVDADVAERMRRSLDAAGVEVWIDQEDIPPAADWMDQIRDAIDATDVVVVLMSPAWAASDVCADEVEWALDGGKPVVPVVVADVAPADVDPRVASLNWVFMRPSDDWSDGIDRIVEAATNDLDWSEYHAGVLRRAREWSAAGEPTSNLLRGQQLDRAERELALSRPPGQPQPIPLQRSYVQASRSHRSRFLRRVLVGVAAALAVSLALGVAALLARNESERQRQVADENAAQARAAEAEAQQQATAALAGQLAAEAPAEVERDLAAGVLVAAAAYETNPTDEHRLGIANALGLYADVVAVHPDDDLEPLAAVPTRAGVTVVTRTGLITIDPDAGGEPIRAAVFDWEPDGARFDVVTGAAEELAVVIRRGESFDLVVVDLSTATVLWERTADGFIAADVLDDETAIVITDQTGTFWFDALSGDLLRTQDRPNIPVGARAARGDLVAVGDGEVRIAATGETLVDLTPEFRTENAAPFDSIHAVESLEFDPMASILAIGGNDGSVWFGEVESSIVRGFGEPVHGGDGIAVPVVDLAFDSTGAQMVSLGSDGTVGLWNAGRPGGPALQTVRPAVNGWDGAAIALTESHVVVATDRGIVVRSLAASGRLGAVAGTWPGAVFVGAGDGAAITYDANTETLTTADGAWTVPVTGRVVAADIGATDLAYLTEVELGRSELVIVGDDGTTRSMAIGDSAASGVSLGEESVLVVGYCSIEIVDRRSLASEFLRSPCELGGNIAGGFGPDDLPVVRRTLSVTVDGFGAPAMQFDARDVALLPDGDWLIAAQDRILRAENDRSPGETWAAGRFDQVEVTDNGRHLVGAGRDLSIWDVVSARPMLSVPLWDDDGGCSECEITADPTLERIDIVGLIDWSSFDRTHVVFDLSAEGLLDAVCAIARRDLTPAEWGRFEVGDRPVPNTCTS